MTADELVRAAVDYGADGAGIKDRFGDNAELFELCLRDFVDGPYMAALTDAVLAQDYPKAFDAAHALKGLSGNLGLTPYYKAMCALVESLRAKNYGNVASEYAETERQYQMIQRICAGERAYAADHGETAPKRAGDSAPARKRNGGKKKERFVPIAMAVALLAILLVLFLFRNIVSNYEKNVTTESAGHLAEINYQLKEYIEDQVENDWLIAHTVKSYIARSAQTDGDAGLLDVMRELRGIWKVSDIILYTDSGFSVSGNGETRANDLASNMIAEAYERGGYMKIVDSDIMYTVPVETDTLYNGSRVAAVSVVKSMESFLDEMGFSSFDESAYVYLCESNGAVISRLNNDSAEVTYNVMSLFKDSAVTTITNQSVSVEDMMAVDVPTTYIWGEDYVVFTPVQTRQDIFRLAYFVPENVVNRTMSGFSSSVTTSSLMVIATFLVLAVLTVVYVNSIRKKQFDTALLAREHMFDLLVKNSQTAFALFEVDRQSPVYISSNSLAVAGDDQPALYKTKTGFELRSGANDQTPALAQINETLGGWDGKSVYRSGFIQNTKAVPPNYYEVQLMRVGEESDEYIGVAQDVTLLHERETVTRNALVMAEQASDAKTRFLSNMSHDIRTPMNAIVNMADFAIEDMANPERLRDDLKTIRESSDHLLGLINDILDMSRIESGKTTIDIAPFDLGAELKRLQSIISPLCAQREQTLIVDFSGVSPILVLGDQIKVSQILMNLLSNAVKFTPRNGAVRFSAKEVPSIRENYVNICFTVEDTGMGISQAYLPHIFQPFSREDVKRISGIQGTGLGLSICHSYVVAMGGQIKCESVEGDGTTFTVELFFEKTDAAPPPHAETTAWDVTPFIGMRCLFCEDNPTNQRIGKTVLELLGFRVDLAGDGREGLTTFKKSLPGYYDVIYMDIQMPNMDGYEATAAIRECKHVQARTVPIIAVSANVFIEDVEKAHIAGMDGHVGKPINTAALANETKRVLNKSGRRTI